MAVQVSIIGGPSREDLFDTFRLASRDHLFPVSFKTREINYPLILSQIHGMERVDKRQFVTELETWIITAELRNVPSAFRQKNEKDMFAYYRVTIRYNTKSRQGYATIARMKQVAT